VPWHWKQFDASSRPSVFDGCATSVAVAVEAVVVEVVLVDLRADAIWALPSAPSALAALVSDPPPQAARLRVIAKAVSPA
jgi:hypothetical protein